MEGRVRFGLRAMTGQHHNLQPNHRSGPVARPLFIFIHSGALGDEATEDVADVEARGSASGVFYYNANGI